MRPLRVRVHPDVERELQQAFHCYEDRRAGPGAEFLTALFETVSRLARNPDASPLLGKRTRRVLLRKFPYFLLYVVLEDEVIVTAAFHLSRSPDRWSDRVREHVSGAGVSTPAVAQR